MAKKGKLYESWVKNIDKTPHRQVKKNINLETYNSKKSYYKNGPNHPQRLKDGI